MHLSLPPERLAQYLRLQLERFFPDGGDLADVPRVTQLALARTEQCLARTLYGLNWEDRECRFSHLVADQYLIFVYYASSVAYTELDNVDLAAKLFCLNKALHGFHCMYDTQLPDTFVVVHGTGIVLGKAQYGEQLVVMHGVTVGANFDHEIPVIGKRVVLYPGASVIGKTTIDNDSCVTAGAFVNDTIVPSGSLVIGRSPTLTFKRNRADRLKRFYASET